MRFPFPGIGIVFNIDGLGGGSYGYQAWRLFFEKIDPWELRAHILVEGDTDATLVGKANEFCIGVYGSVDYVRKTFENLNEPGLAAFHRRFIEKIALDDQPLILRGQIDALARLTTDYWRKVDHNLCKEFGWGYDPKTVPSGIDARLLNELEELRKPNIESLTRKPHK